MAFDPLKGTLADGTASGEALEDHGTADVQQIVGSAQQAADEVVSKTVTQLQAAISTGVGQLSALLAAQDGWTVTITVPPIVIRLAKEVKA